MENAIVLGGTEDHIRVVEVLKQRGYRVTVLDYHDDCPAKRVADHYIRQSTLDEGAVTDAAREMGAKIVLALCIDQALLTMACVSEKLGLPCYLSYQQALELTNKAWMKQRMAAHGIPTSPFAVLESEKDAEAAVSKLRYPLVVKPADSNSSKGITRVECPERLPQAVSDAFSHTRSGEVVAEELVDGEEYSADFFIRDGEPTLIVSTKTFKTPLHKDRFLIVNSMSPNGLNAGEMGRLCEIVRRISQAFNIVNGPLFIQFIKSGDELNVIEFSSRIGGGSRHHFVRHARSFDYAEFLVHFSLGEKPPISLKDQVGFYGCQFVYCHPGVMCEVRGLEEAKQQARLLDYFFYRPINSRILGNDSSAQRPLGFIVRADNYADLCRRVAEIDADLRILDENGNDLMIHGLHFGNVGVPDSAVGSDGVDRLDATRASRGSAVLG